ncbi:metalloprotease [Rhexocercosporidium sp. MPI-PUGE-AT-0058]|nr:metalloprotease [Rhexocercosporidium sp. MPI-PUGE-AT-0058]
MRSSTLLLGSSLLGLSIAHPSTFSRQEFTLPSHRGCLVSEDDSLTPLPSSLTPQNTRRQQNSTLTVPVNFHIASHESDASLITDTIASAQFAVLHDNFGAHNIELVLNSTSRVVDNLTGSAFFVNEAQEEGGNNWVRYRKEEAAYYRATRRGGIGALNMYFFSRYVPGGTGFCQFPTLTPLTESDPGFWTDSCQISALTMPGIPSSVANPTWNLGHIAVHEAGHWFGLNHTFAGGCGATGDFVADTPAQRGDDYGCPVGEDTCPDMEGEDPIRNFMGYTDDSCTSEFTNGQEERMFHQYLTYRWG